MIVYPAIDLRGGRVVRLKEGHPDRQTVFSDDPLATAQAWVDQGASWIHMINLDGAFDAHNDNLRVLEHASRLGVPIQFGGGIRSIAAIEEALSLGASRVILGTIAVEQPDLVTEALDRFGPETICVGLDARDGKVTTRGWMQSTNLTPLILGQMMAECGAVHALYTDVNRDGKLTGSNIERTIALGVETGLQIIASGGVSTAEEIEQLAQSGSVAGVIIGMALYEGKLALPDALHAARSPYAG